MVVRLEKFRRHLSPELVAVLTVSGFTFFSGQLLTPILPLFIAEKGVDTQTLGLLFSTLMLGFGVGEIFWGWFADRADLKILLLMGTVISGVVISGFLFAQSLLTLFVVFFLFGLFRSPMPIASRWYIGVHAPRHLKASFMALFGAVIALTQSISGFTSGLIADIGSYRDVITLAACISGLIGIVLIGSFKKLDFRKIAKHEITDNKEEENPGRRNRKVIQSVIGLGLLAVLFFISYSIVNTFVPLFASDIHETSSTGVGVLFGVSGLVSFLVVIPLGRLADKKDKHTLIILSLILVAISVTGMATSKDYFMLLINLGIFSFSFSMFMPTGMALISESVPSHRQGIAMGVYGLFEDVGAMIGPAIGGFLWVTWGPKSPFLAAGLISVVGAILFVMAKYFSNLRLQSKIKQSQKDY